jgi:hypothetical protein
MKGTVSAIGLQEVIFMCVQNHNEAEHAESKPKGLRLVLARRKS